jgi:hypothetical protein
VPFPPVADIPESSDDAAMSDIPGPRLATAIVASLALCAACGTGTADGAREETQLLTTVAASAEGNDVPTTFFDDSPLDLPSPDRRFRLVSTPSADGLIPLIAVRESDGWRQVVGSYEPPTAVLWSPSSKAFFVNDQRGSGQSSHLEVVRLEGGRFRRDVAARANLNGLYNRFFRCSLPDNLINTAGEGWMDASTIIVDVQASHHSGGCPLDPFAANRLVLLVNARTGEVLHRPAARR